MAGTVRIKLVKSPIGYARDQKATVRSLGLRRMQHEVELPDSPTVRGMIFKVRHLVRVIEPAPGAEGEHETA
jgi:large subunit ribosomal protein L30